MKLDVAICQFDMAWCEVAANLAAAERFVAASTADVVVLPEMFATGFVTDTDSVAQPMDGEIVAWLVRSAVHYGRAIAGSAIIREEGRCFNRMFFAMPSGRIVWADKRHLFGIGGENAYLSAGDRRVVVEYRGFRFLLLVCYDLRFPVWSRCRDDYDVIIYSASWAAARRNAWRTLLRARAIENEAYVIGVNRVGSDPVALYAGDSAVIDFKGDTMAEMADGEGTLVATVDKEALGRFRDKFPAWRDADSFIIER